jgi:hypothetical protein
MEFPGLLINPPALFEDFYSLAVVTLIGRHICDIAVAMPVVVPLHKIHNPQSTSRLAPCW